VCYERNLMALAWQLTSLGFLAFAVVMLVESLTYPLMDRLGPGPGLLPLGLSVMTAAIALAVFIQVMLGRVAEASHRGQGVLPAREVRGRIVAVVVTLILVLLLLAPLGFRATMFLFLIVLPRALGARNWWALLIFATAGSFGLHWVLSARLQLPLPAGFFEF